MVQEKSTLVAALIVGAAALSCSSELGSSPGAGVDGAGTGGGDGALPDPSDPTVCVPGVPGTSQIPRLTQHEYDNTIRDLLGLEGEPSTMLAPDPAGRSVDQRAWDGYQLAARTLATQVMETPASRALVIPCEAGDDGGAACATQLITEFGRRAFRRPLTEAEVARFSVLFTNRAAITPTGSFDDTAALIIEAFLLSPSFLMRTEIAENAEGTYFKLTGYEVASRLSYLLWGSMPDDALLEAAASGALDTPTGILAEAGRLLGDARAREMVAAFHEKYMHMGPNTRWNDMTRDTSAFPLFTEELVPLLSEETHRFFDHVVFDAGGSFQDLMTSPVAFVNEALAPLYGLDPAAYSGAELRPAEVAGRPGVLTRVGFLASHSFYDRSSPIHRGAFIQKHVLCAEIGSPPPGAEGTPLPTEGLNTNRERVDAQTAASGCKSCHHTSINPTGFAFEAFDAIGGHQEVEWFSDAPITTNASVPVGATNVDVAGAADLMSALATSPDAQGCYARQWVSFAFQRLPNNQDSCIVDDMTQKLTAGGYRVLDLILDLTQSQSFGYRALEVEVAP